MPVNLKKIREANQELESRSSGILYNLNRKLKSGEEIHLRLLDPSEDLNGLYYIEVVGWWINDKFYISPETWNEKDPIDAKIAKINAGRDESLKELVKFNKVFKKQSNFIFEGYIVETEETSKDDNPPYIVDGLKIIPVTKKPTIIQASTMVIQGINKIANNRTYNRHSENGIFDQEEGFYLAVEKTGKEQSTKYNVTGWRVPCPVLPEILEAPRIDLWKYLEEHRVNDDKLLDAFDEYLGGRKRRRNDDEDNDETPKRSRKRMEDDDEDERPARKRVKEEDEDDRPVRKAKEEDRPARRKASDEDERPARKVTYQEEEGEDDEEPKAKKGGVRFVDKPTPSKRTASADFADFEE